MASRQSATVVVATQRGTFGERILRKQGRLLLYVIAFVVASFFVAPYLWTVGSSLKTSLEVREFPPALFPTGPRFQNYLDIWQVVPLGAFFLNSVQVTVLAMIGQLTSATLVAYGFSRFRFPGRRRPVHVW